jgi:hypothetical protein
MINCCTVNRTVHDVVCKCVQNQFSTLWMSIGRPLRVSPLNLLDWLLVDDAPDRCFELYHLYQPEIAEVKVYRGTNVNTRPIFLSRTLKRATRFSSGPSDSRFVVTVNCHVSHR